MTTVLAAVGRVSGRLGNKRFRNLSRSFVLLLMVFS